MEFYLREKVIFVTLILDKVGTSLPVFRRPLEYVIPFVLLSIPFLLVIQGMVTDSSLLFYKKCTKLLMMLRAVMILFALSRNGGREAEIIRNKATHDAIFLTILFLLRGTLYRVIMGDIVTVDTSSFLIFLITNVPCLEFGMKKT